MYEGRPAFAPANDNPANENNIEQPKRKLIQELGEEKFNLQKFQEVKQALNDVRESGEMFRKLNDIEIARAKQATENFTPAHAMQIINNADRAQVEEDPHLYQAFVDKIDLYLRDTATDIEN